MYFTLPLLLDTKFSLRYFNELLTYAWPSMQPFVPSPNNPPYKWLLEGRSIAWLHKKQLFRRLEYIQFVSISIRQNKNLVGWVKKILCLFLVAWDLMQRNWLLPLDLLTSRAFERVARLWVRSAIVWARSASERARSASEGPTTPDQKTKRTTLRKSMLPYTPDWTNAFAWKV